jgi:hypothetical protein
MTMVRPASMSDIKRRLSAGGVTCRPAAGLAA